MLNGKKKKKTLAELPDSVKFGKQGRGNKKKEYKLQKFAQKTGKKSGSRKNDASSTYNDTGFNVKQNKTPFPGMAKKTAGKKPVGGKKAGGKKGGKRPNPSARRAKVIRKATGGKKKK